MTSTVERPSPAVPHWLIRLIWTLHRGLYSVTRGHFGLRTPTSQRWGTLRLTTVGRRTGRRRVVIVGYLEDGANLISPAMNGWMGPDPAWWLNLQANPDATVTLRTGEIRHVHARAADPEERQRLWKRLVDLGSSAYTDANAATRSTETQIAVLEPRPIAAEEAIAVDEGRPAAAGSRRINDPTRRSALVAGLLYLVTFVSSIAAVFLLAPVLNDAAYVIGAGADRQVTLGATLDLVNALACIGTAVALFSVIKRKHEGLAVGFVTTRMFEAAVIAIGVVCLLAVTTLRQQGAAVAEVVPAQLVVSQALVAVRDWTFLMGPSLMPAFNALLLGTLMLRSGLVPRWIPTFGLIGAPLLIASTLATMFGFNDQSSAWTAIATAPIFLWELALGLYLAFKGFRRTSPLVVAATEAQPAVRPARALS
jgi:deazaflavin-dependent oxidoreductase (nitroreductase family)